MCRFVLFGTNFEISKSYDVFRWGQAFKNKKMDKGD